jgi:N-acetylglutamate synthase-like GNAT family acetyltransferase
MIVYRPVEDDLREYVKGFITQNWGSPVMVTRGRVHSVDKLPGFVAVSEEDIKGLITYHIYNNECEIVSLDSLMENQGVGSSLLKCVVEKARGIGCKRIWLIR